MEHCADNTAVVGSIPTDTTILEVQMSNGEGIGRAVGMLFVVIIILVVLVLIFGFFGGWKILELLSWL